MIDVDSVLFDLDGTLTNPFVGISSSVLYALEKMGKAPLDRETLGRFIGPPLQTSFRAECGMTEAQAERAVALYREYYEKSGVFALEVYDGIADMLKSLKAAGKKLYIATSKPENFAVMIRDRYFKEIDGVAGASHDLSRSEKSDVMRYALERFNIDPKRAVMVGDRIFDVVGANSVGANCIGVLYGYGKKEEFENAKWVARTPSEVADIILR